jgi:hypothetical protein
MVQTIRVVARDWRKATRAFGRSRVFTVTHLAAKLARQTTCATAAVVDFQFGYTGLLRAK